MRFWGLKAMKQLNLISFFNHKMLSNDNIIFEYPDENWGICGNFFKIESFCACMGIKNINQTASGYDNTICESQNIPIGESLSSIEFIGFSEWGSFEETVFLKSKNRKKELKLFFYEWHTNPHFVFEKEINNNNCKIKCVLETNKGEKVYIYRTLIKIKENALWEHLILPNNPAMHIFAINIYRKKI